MEENKILQTIKSGGIKPIPKIHFLIKRYLVIALGIVVTIFGGFIFAKIVASLLLTGWEYWDYVSDSFTDFAYFVLPLAWIVLLFLFTLLMPFILSKTAHGYKYKKAILVLISILLSVVLGFIILKTGAFTGVNKFFINSASQNEAMIWTQPAQGRLSGHITVRSNDSLILEDYRRNIWAVDISNILPASKTVVQENDNIRIVGIAIDENTFVACQILPFYIDKKLFLEERGYDQDDDEEDSTVMTKDVCSTILYSGL